MCLLLNTCNLQLRLRAALSRARVSSHTSGPESSISNAYMGVRRSYCTLYPLLENPVRQYVLSV